MFLEEDRTFQDILEKSVNKWLDQMEAHEDLSVKNGVKAVREHIASLKREVQRLEEKNKVKDRYLKKIREEK